MKRAVFSKSRADDAKKRFRLDRKLGKTMRVEVAELESLLLFGVARGVSQA